MMADPEPIMPMGRRISMDVLNDIAGGSIDEDQMPMKRAPISMRVMRGY